MTGMIRAFRTLLRSSEYLAFTLSGTCRTTAWFTFAASVPLVLFDLLDQPPSTYGLMILLPVSCYVLGTGLAARLATRAGSLRLVLCGRALALGAAIGMSSWWWFGRPECLDAVCADGARVLCRRAEPSGDHGLGRQRVSAS